MGKVGCYMMRLDRPAHVFVAEEVEDDKSWYHDIKCFLQNHEYPPGASKKDKKTKKVGWQLLPE